MIQTFDFFYKPKFQFRAIHTIQYDVGHPGIEL